MTDEKDLKGAPEETEGCGCENGGCSEGGDCGCGHDHEHHHDHEGEEVEVQTVFIENEDGTTDELLVVEEFEYNGSQYILVQNEDETVTPLKAVGEEGELEFLSDEEFEEVSKAFNEALEMEDEDEDEEDTEDSEDTKSEDFRKENDKLAEDYEKDVASDDVN